MPPIKGTEASKKGHKKLTPAAREAAQAIPKLSEKQRQLRKGKKFKENGKPIEGMTAHAEIVGKCGGIKRDGVSKCNLPAGYATKHPGIGRCKYHGGSTPNSLKSALQTEARLMGCPIDMNPVEAIIWCIRISAGEVQWLSEQIARLDKENWIENTVIGKQMNLFVRERKEAQYRLFKFSRDAISLGLAERAIKLAEMYGEVLARFMKGVLDDLELTPAQRKQAPHIVRKHLILLEGGRPVTKEDIRALPRSA